MCFVFGLPTGDTMNAPDKLAQFIRLTREPLPSSRKIYVPGRRADI